MRTWEPNGDQCLNASQRANRTHSLGSSLVCGCHGLFLSSFLSQLVAGSEQSPRQPPFALPRQSTRPDQGATCTYDKYGASLSKEESGTNNKNDLERRLDELRLEYRKIYSMLSMMEKGTSERNLKKMRAEQLDPINAEINRLEKEMDLLS
jgi:hypothetical protein